MTTKKAVFIGIDGAQLEKYLLLDLKGQAQNFNGLDIVESYVGGVQGTSTEQVTSSGPGWSTLLSGVWVDQHGVPSNNDQPIAPEVDSLFEIIDANIENANIASIVNWAPINTGHFAEDTGLLGEPAIVDTEAHGISDVAVTQTVVDLILEEAPDFTFMHLDNVDGVGHSFGFGEEYDQSLTTVDFQIGQILAAVAQRELENADEEWLVIVSTDHGRTGTTGTDHGGQSTSERRTFIAANVDLGSFADAVPATSVATTILDFLDIEYQLSAGGLVSGSLLAGAPDPLPPVIEEITLPADDASRVPVDTDLSIRFSEAMVAGAGNVIVRNAADGSAAATVDVASPRVTIAGDTVTIDLEGILSHDTEYFIEIEAGAFTDGTNAFAGISDAATWNFTTETDLQAPLIVSLDPADDLTGVALGSDLVVTFNETVVAGDGDILLRRGSDGSIVETIAATSGRVAIDGSTVTIDPVGDLLAGTDYYVEIEAGAFRDTSTLATLFSEDFEALPLEPFVSGTESGGDGTDFTATLPAGWTSENTTPAGGPVEFFGWTFLDKNSWIRSSGDQERSQFTNASGTVLVADPDEYDDGAVGVDPDLFNARISLPGIDVSNVAAGTATLSFDSSWRPEDNQKATLTVSYDGGPEIELLRWTSDPSDPDFKPDNAVNEALTVALENPAGASTAVVTFSLLDGGNDWWWALDNLLVQGETLDGTGGGNAFAGIVGADGWNFTTAAGTSEPIVLTGTAADDAFTGASGDDVLSGRRGADELEGLAGEDVLNGGDGDDTLDGGDDADTLIGGFGDDTIDGGGGDDFARGNDGDDTIDGKDGDDRLFGLVGNDTIDGGAGEDIVNGGKGSDILLGGEGDDTVRGEAGDDAITGGAGDDRLFGGEGSDQFIFLSGHQTDRVMDFDAGFDLLDYSGHVGVSGLGDLTFLQVGKAAHIADAADGLVILADTNAADLTADLFVFA